MKNEMYDEIVKKYTPKEDILKNAIITFLAGGAIGALSELLLVCYSTLLNLPRKESGISNFNFDIYFFDSYCMWSV